MATLIRDHNALWHLFIVITHYNQLLSKKQLQHDFRFVAAFELPQCVVVGSLAH